MKQYKKYIDYLKVVNTTSIAIFDRDWEPIGPVVRKDMERLGIIKQKKGVITLVKK